MRFLSLGAGVQSSTLALMIKHGEVPMVDGAVFADTQDEPAEVYTWLDWLEKQLTFPVYRVSKGRLSEMACVVRTSKGGKSYTQHAVPAFITDGVDTGLAMRQCTQSFKIDEIYRQYTRLRNKKPVTQLIGISIDEYQRMKPPRRNWVTNEYPLVNRRISRRDCVAWMLVHGYPIPPRSACVYCPYMSDAERKRQKTDDPKSFTAAVTFEQNYQKAFARVTGMRGTPYLHRSCVPLDKVDFDGDKVQTDMFINECEGMCGV